jgi:hypothetical protein
MCARVLFHVDVHEDVLIVLMSFVNCAHKFALVMVLLLVNQTQALNAFPHGGSENLTTAGDAPSNSRQLDFPLDSLRKKASQRTALRCGR